MIDTNEVNWVGHLVLVSNDNCITMAKVMEEECGMLLLSFQNEVIGKEVTYGGKSNWVAKRYCSVIN